MLYGLGLVVSLIAGSVSSKRYRERLREITGAKDNARGWTLSHRGSPVRPLFVLGYQMNSFSILLFSGLLFLSQGMTVALITYFLGAPSFEGWDPFRFLLIMNGPACFVSIVVFYFLARKQLARPYTHAFFVLIVAELLDIFATSLITKQLFYSPTWTFDLPISIFALLIGTALGIKDNQWEKVASSYLDKIGETKKE